MTIPGAVLRGRGQLLLILGMLLVLILAPMLAEWLRGDLRRVGGHLLTLGLTAGLFGQAFRGTRWARHLTVALAFIGGMLAALLGLIASTGSDWGFVVFFVGLAFIGCGFALIALPDVETYLEARRGERP
ncbi:hypothetical protein [Deinococcus peraridilitoris]|uniref:hypothetical protein n=1 Tax=Deinococcus peraridilitoris TaxID=432329 RepID=UPI0012FCC793|nr:hypothetical protein [Deinococcus peraridilitoris]